MEDWICVERERCSRSIAFGGSKRERELHYCQKARSLVLVLRRGGEGYPLARPARLLLENALLPPSVTRLLLEGLATASGGGDT